MSSTYAVYTYGGGDTLYEVFNAVASLMGGGDYPTLIRMFGVLSLFWVVIEMGVLQHAINCAARTARTGSVLDFALFDPDPVYAPFPDAVK